MFEVLWSSETSWHDDTALQTRASSAKQRIVDVKTHVVMSLMKMRNNIGPITVH